MPGNGRKPSLLKRELTVRADIGPENVTEFCYTLSSSTDPPRYQRYRFSIRESRAFFHHEKREGDHWPLREADVAVAVAGELTRAEWDALFDLLRDGTAEKRKESAESGRSGPWLYLYWRGDRSVWQAYAFPTRWARSGVEDFCAAPAEGK